MDESTLLQHPASLPSSSLYPTHSATAPPKSHGGTTEIKKERGRTIEKEESQGREEEEEEEGDERISRLNNVEREDRFQVSMAPKCPSFEV